MVETEIFAQVVRDAVIRDIPRITVFYDDIYKLPQGPTTYYSRQYVVPKGPIAVKINPADLGSKAVQNLDVEATSLNWNAITYEKTFVEKNLNLKSLDVENYLKELVDTTNKELAQEIDYVIYNKIKSAATVVAGKQWYADGTPYFENMKSGIMKAMDEMSKSPYWTPNLISETVLYLPSTMAIVLRDLVDVNMNTSAEEVLKKWVGEIKYTPVLTNEAILSIKNDKFGAIMYEVQDSPLTNLEENFLTTEYYVGITMDVQVLPEDKATGKTRRIINITGIL
jgi:hypothetical protein